jgi:hypothetical protein
MLEIGDQCCLRSLFQWRRSQETQALADQSGPTKLSGGQYELLDLPHQYITRSSPIISVRLVEQATQALQFR